MYLDNTHTSRSGWRYTYKGGDMLPFVNAKLTLKADEERQAREEVIRLTRDPATNPTDRKVEEAKRAVVATATVVEELMVYVHQFIHEPEKEYHLSSGDVVFFGLINSDIRSSVEAAITPKN